ncbi:MAG TPA: ABC transporter permease [Candidatus Limnocylindrales bacterium]|nr:ABC transporter permease [Candidatus Limnocylindrales bacterium]
MRIALLVALKDLRQRVRDRTAPLVSVVAPLGLAIIFSQLLAGATGFTAVYVVSDMDGGTLARTFRDDVLGTFADGETIRVVDVATESEALAAVEQGTADAAFLVPAGFTNAIEAGQSTTIEIIGARDEGLATEIARALAQQFGDGVTAVQLSVATAVDLAPVPPTEAEVGRITAIAAAAPPPVALVDSTTELRQLTLPTYFSASMAILFLFFSAQIGLVSLFEERRQGTLARILAGPIAPWTVLAGKTIGSFALGLFAMTVLVVATTLLIGASWGPPLGVALMVVTAITAAIGISTLVVSFARTEEAAGAASAAVAITLGILGGTFSPTAQAPEVMTTLSLLTPHGWFLRGLGEMAGPTGTAADCLGAAAVLLLMGLVTGGLGMVRARSLVRAA